MVRVMLSSIVGVDESRDGDTIHLGESHDYRFSAPWEFYPPDYEHVPSSGPPLGSYEDYVTGIVYQTFHSALFPPIHGIK